MPPMKIGGNHLGRSCHPLLLGKSITQTNKGMDAKGKPYELTMF
jgi:hypothetical protein